MVAWVPPGSAGVVENQVSPELRAALAAATLGLYRGPTAARQAYGLELLGQGAAENDQKAKRYFLGLCVENGR